MSGLISRTGESRKVRAESYGFGVAFHQTKHTRQTMQKCWSDFLFQVHAKPLWTTINRYEAPDPRQFATRKVH
jgi:hypothetical protein